MGAHFSVRVAEIDWDTDGEKIEALPSTMEFRIHLPDDEPSETELNTAMTDHMSDTTGWCVNSFTIEECERSEPAPAP